MPQTLTRTIITIVLLILAGCFAPLAAPTPVPPTVPPVTPTPAGWQEHTTAALSISLPATWQTLTVTADNLQKTFDDFQQANPALAKLVGSSQALQGVSLWAFNTAEANPAFTDNLNIRRSPLNGEKITKMQEVVDAVSPTYQKQGFRNIQSQTDLTIGGHSAVRMTYSFDVNGVNGEKIAVDGQQYIVLTDADLWILSYTLGPGQAAALGPVVQQSAQSFKVK
jgi:hypothetical protein